MALQRLYFWIFLCWRQQDLLVTNYRSNENCWLFEVRNIFTNIDSSTLRENTFTNVNFSSKRIERKIREMFTNTLLFTFIRTFVDLEKENCSTRNKILEIIFWSRTLDWSRTFDLIKNFELIKDFWISLEDSDTDA